MNRLARPLSLLFAGLFHLGAATAANCLSNATGNWSAAGTWTTCNGTTPQPADTVQIRGGNNVTMNTTATVASLQVGSTAGSNTSTLTFAAGSSLTVSGTITMSGNNSNRNGTINMTAGGTLIANGSPAFAFGAGTETWTPGTGTVQLGSTNTLPWAAAVLSTFHNLIIAANTTTLGGPTTINGNLTVNGMLAGATTMSWTGAGAIIDGTGAITNTGATTITNNKTISNTAVLEIAGPLTISTGTTTNNGTLCFGLSGGGTCPSITGDTLTVTSTLANAGTINTSSAISVGGTLTNTGTVTTTDTVTGIAGAGSYTNAAGSTLNIAGPLTVTTFTATANGNTVNYNGTTAAQTLRATTYYNLGVNNANGLTLSAGNATISNTLTFTTGVVTTTGTNTVITTASCAAPSVSRTSGHVASRLQKAIPTGASTCVFEVGGSTAADYTPVQTTYTGITTTGNVLAVVTGVDHPSLSGSGIDTTQSVNRYWTLAAPVTGALPIAAAGATYDAQFTFVPAVAGEVDAGASALAFVIKRFSASTWSAVTLGTRTATSTSGTGLLLTTGYGDFALGEPTVANFSREQQFIYTRELY